MKIRNTENEREIIGGRPYIDVARSYYKGLQYEDDVNVVDGLFDETIPVFNAVPKVVDIATSLATSGELEIVSSDKDSIKTFIDENNLNELKVSMCKDLILGKSILVEVTPVLDDPFRTIPFEVTYYTSDTYNLLKANNKIMFAEVEGIRLEFNQDSQTFNEVEVLKRFINDESGARSAIIVGGEEIESTTYNNGRLPLTEIVTNYDMKQLFYAVDRHNELESFIRNIFYLAGEPTLIGIGIDKIKETDASSMTSDRYKRQKTLTTRNMDAQISLLEIQGSSASIMIEKQAEIIKNITKDFPEYAISDVLSGGNVSEETTRIRLTEILSRINELRRCLEGGLNLMFYELANINGGTPEQFSVRLSTMLNADIAKLMSVIKEAIPLGLISKESARHLLKDLYIGDNIDNELSRIEADEAENMKKQEEMINSGINNTNNTGSSDGESGGSGDGSAGAGSSGTAKAKKKI